MDGDDLSESLPREGDRDTFETDYSGQPPSIALVEAIATIEGVDQTGVEFSLYETLDPDALNELFTDPEDDETTILYADDEAEDKIETTDNRVVAEFEIERYRVQIQSDGKLTIEAPKDSK